MIIKTFCCFAPFRIYMRSMFSHLSRCPIQLHSVNFTLLLATCAFPGPVCNPISYRPLTYTVFYAKLFISSSPDISHVFFSDLCDKIIAVMSLPMFFSCCIRHSINLLTTTLQSAQFVTTQFKTGSMFVASTTV